MSFRKRSLFKVLPALILTSLFVQTTATKNGFEETFKLLEEGTKNFKISENKDIVLVLGNTGSGKSTLLQWLISDASKLMSQEVVGGEFVVFGDKISQKTTDSANIVPELMEKNGKPFYEISGFSPFKTSSEEIASTFFVKSLIDGAEKVKMIFVVDHGSVKMGADEQLFIQMLHQSADFLTNVKKFNESIGLIVTKVDNNYRKGALIEDNQVIKNVRMFLEGVRTILTENFAESYDENEAESLQKQIDLIDIFMSQNGGKLSKIGIFRRPEEQNSLNKIPLLEGQKKRVLALIENEIFYSPKTDEDFSYKLSKNSLNDFQESFYDEAFQTNLKSFDLSFLNKMDENFSVQTKVSNFKLNLPPVLMKSEQNFNLMSVENDPSEHLKNKIISLIKTVAEELENVQNYETDEMLKALDRLYYNSVLPKEKAKSFVEKVFRIDNIVKTALTFNPNFKTFMTEFNAAAQYLKNDVIRENLFQIENTAVNMKDTEISAAEFEPMFSDLKTKFTKSNENCKIKSTFLFKTIANEIETDLVLFFDRIHDYFADQIEISDVYSFPDSIRLGYLEFEKVKNTFKANPYSENPSRLLKKTLIASKVENVDIDLISSSLVYGEDCIEFLKVLDK